MIHRLQCRCGTIRGTLDDTARANRAICYCKDCQAFQYFLGPPEVLDTRGGSEVIQVLPRSLTFTHGLEALACMRLTPKGLLRWYASCCRTPIGNTLASPGIPFIGLLRVCLDVPDTSVNEAFGSQIAHVNTKSARGDPKPEVSGLGRSVAWFIRTVLKARLNGDYRRTPLFRADTSAPIVVPRVLSAEEHSRLMAQVQAAAR
jgi:hypothetical protein